MEVQTRDNDGEIHIWPSIGEAFAAASKDRSIWKISWTNEETLERIRLVRTASVTPAGRKGRVVKGPEVWVYEPILVPRIETLPDNLTVEHFLKDGEA